jgi:DNA-binding transcriptional LysR family regulator
VAGGRATAIHPECSARWIFWIDDDEIPSARLIAGLPELVQATDVTHFWLPRRWLYPTAERFLDQPPWRPHYQLRVVQNDFRLVRFPGETHWPIEAEGPGRYVDLPLYHTDCLLNPLEQREQVTWSDLADYPFISLQGQFTERLLSDMHSSLRDIPLNPANEVTFMTTALAMVSAGLGVTVCLPYAEPLVRLYKLHMRQLHDPELTRRFFVYTRQNRSLSPAADSFIAYLFKYVEAHDWNIPAPL